MITRSPNDTRLASADASDRDARFPTDVFPTDARITGEEPPLGIDATEFDAAAASNGAWEVASAASHADEDEAVLTASWSGLPPKEEASMAASAAESPSAASARSLVDSLRPAQPLIAVRKRLATPQRRIQRQRTGPLIGFG
ncbi:MAG: hypothetical protein M3O46_02640 [Myxococcota bacterium]|nr:hypothetical protein [Myxococcota bacterium]